MADTTTTNYGFTKPEVAGSHGTWGTKLNTDLDAIDTQIKNRQTEAATAQTTADAALPKAGGTMTGGVQIFTSRNTRVDLGSIVTTATLNFAVGNAWTAQVTGAVTVSVSNVPAGTVASAGVLKLVNGGSATVTWPGSFQWPGGTAPTLTASGTDLIAFITFDNGTSFYANAIKALA